MAEFEPLMMPSIHLNGTSEAELVDQLADVANALDKALGALAKASPNGRDWYPQGPDALKAAMAERREDAKTLTALRDRYMDLAERIVMRPRAGI